MFWASGLCDFQPLAARDVGARRRGPFLDSRSTVQPYLSLGSSPIGGHWLVDGIYWAQVSPSLEASWFRFCMSHLWAGPGVGGQAPKT